MEEQIKLNLSRKWRSLNFEGIVGQDLAIKMIKNSLYAAHYFPVYLFAGQRGCGKTTTARVFASALNCERLSEFQKKPRDVAIPCESCNSCVSMMLQKHPDFIEIDAASHTGVDNIRQIIESSSFMPVIGQKKIYLIDEAHMLSKAAFSALLKILEEPPKNAIFILATTDQEKIIDTVRSRCFRLIFNSIDREVLILHLKEVCTAERINYDDEGLFHIATHAQGSARDALNIIEQVRFSSSGITKKTVLNVLNCIDDLPLLNIIKIVYNGDVRKLLLIWQEYNIDAVSIDFVRQRLLRLCRIFIWNYHRVHVPDIQAETKLVVDIISEIPLSWICNFMEVLYKAEQSFMRTGMAREYLEMLLVQLCTRRRVVPFESESSSALQDSAVTDIGISEERKELTEDENEDDAIDEEPEEARLWQTVIARLKENNDPLVHSMFHHAVLHHVDKELRKIIIMFPTQVSFFAELLANSANSWKPMVCTVFGDDIKVELSFKGNSAPAILTNTQYSDLKNVAELAKKIETKLPLSPKSNNTAKTQEHQKETTRSRWKGQSIQNTKATSERVIDVSNTTLWPQVNRILDHFPGTVFIIKEMQQ